ncbi:ROK family protein [Devosia ginsengisoli]|uniref:ROK family protein n=1 Tax=Devosia ginsengisoli TaxID=400770 RepID=A0A5B8LXZ2_9HYPH|nr:ROK family protein [Devosia ginsengisoli]QDZ12669.1 ROK family protein [Devosia ginsengisoli]
MDIRWSVPVYRSPASGKCPRRQKLTHYSKPGFPTATIGIDLGGTRYKIGWQVAGGGLTDTVTLSTGSHRKVDVVLAEVAEAVSAMVERAHLARESIVAVGIGVPAVIDPAVGRIILLPNFSESWQGFLLTDALSALIGLPVYLINDARSFTLAEARLGAGRGTANLLGVTLGTGVGGGLVLDGKLRFGPNHMAGEFGHISIDPHGLRCGCGGLGCIESYASGPAIAATALRPLLQGRAPMLRELIGGDLNELDADAVAAAAREGEAECREIFERVGHAVGLGIAHVMKIADIERVIVGGGVAEAGEMLFGPIRETVRANTAVFGPVQPQIAAASIEQPGATGAALWARERFSEEHRA